MAENVGYATLNVLPSAKGFGKALKGDIDPALASAGASAGSSLGGKLKAVAGPLFALAGTVAMGAFVKNAITEAGKLEQSMGAIATIFKGGSVQMLQWSRDAAISTGLARNEYNELATLIGSQLKNAGTAMDELGPKTNDLITLGADLSSMFGGTSREAVEALSSALKGERDPIEKYGVSLKQASIDAKAAELGFQKVGGTLSSEANAAATLALIMEQTADAHGNFAKEATTYEGVGQRLAASWANISATIGQGFLPFATAAKSLLLAMMPAVQGVADRFAVFGATMTTAFQNAGGGMAGIRAMFATAFAGLGTWLSGDGLAALIDGYYKAQLGLVTFITQNIPAIAVAISNGLVNLALGLSKTVEAVLTQALPAVITGLQTVVSALVTALPQVISTLAFGLASGLPLIIQSAIDLMSGIVQAVTEVLPDLISAITDGIGQAITALLGQVPTLLSAGIKLFTSLVKAVVTIVPQLLEAGIQLFQQIVVALAAVLPDIIGALVSAIPQLMQVITDAIPTLLASLTGIVTETLPVVLEAILGTIPLLVTALTELFPQLLTALISMLPSLVETSVTLFQGIIDGLLAALPVIITAVLDLVPVLGNALLEQLPVIIQAAIELFLGLLSGLLGALPDILVAVVNAVPQIINSLLSMLPALINGAIQLFMGIILGLVGALPQILAAVIGLIPLIVISLVGMIPTLVLGAIQLFLGIVSGLAKALPDIIKAVVALVPTMVGELVRLVPKFVDAGKQLIHGLMDGISKMASTIGKFFLSLLPDWIVGPFKAALGIHSPSRVFKGFGVNIGEGLVNGIDGMQSDVAKSALGLATAAQDAVDGMSIALGADVSGAVPDGGVYGALSGTGYGSSTTLNYTQNGGQGLTAEQELVKAARRLKPATP